MKSASIILIAAAFAATPAVAGPLNLVQKALVDDFTFASNDAKARGDTRHGQCWDAVLTFVQSDQFPSIPQVHPGVASAAQAFFDLQGIASKPLLPDPVVTGCALTVFDLRASFVNLAARLGIAAALPIKIPTF